MGFFKADDGISVAVTSAHVVVSIFSQYLKWLKSEGRLVYLTAQKGQGGDEQLKQSW